MSLRIHHVGIAVPDLEAAIEWYGRVLGFADPRRHEIEPLQARMAFVRHGSLRLELWQRAGAAPLPDERREPMRHEADPLAPGLPAPFAMFIRDPGGTLIELLDSARVAAELGPVP